MAKMIDKNPHRVAKSFKGSWGNFTTRKGAEFFDVKEIERLSPFTLLFPQVIPWNPIMEMIRNLITICQEENVIKLI
jgi:hypothetical protein